MDNDNFGDGALPRLIERGQIEFAVAFLMGRGVAADSIAANLARRYHIDIDTLNAVLADRYLLDFAGEPELARAA